MAAHILIGKGRFASRSDREREKLPSILSSDFPLGQMPISCRKFGKPFGPFQRAQTVIPRPP
jgi:hypothetical protein